MPDFTVSFWDRDNNAVILPPGLVFTPASMGAVAQGGYDSAQINVSGPELALHPLRSWLRYRVEIWGDAGMVWEGHIDEIMLTLQGVTVTTGVEQMYNAIKVLYSYTGDDGGSETGETEWGTDTDSINEYGRKEAIHSSGGETTSEAATALAATVLAGTKKANAPSISVESGGEESGATLTCSGRFHQLEWRYHTDTGGYEANEQTGERTLLGWTYTAATIGFVQNPYNRLVDYASHLDALEADDPLLISGTWGGSNDGVKVVKTKIGGDPATYTASTISFDPADDVLDSAGGLSFVRAKEGVSITGTTGGLNDGVYLSSDVTSATRFEVASYGASPVVAQAAGPSVTITTAHAVELTTSPVNESSGNTVTLTAYGQKMAQRFQLSNGPWTCGEIAIHIAKWGSPADTVVVSLYSDNGSDQPNALLGFGSILPANVPSQSAAWVSAKLGTPVTLANATKYHIVVSRSGSSHHLNYYTVSRDADGQYSSGALLLWTGSAWAAPYTTTDMSFKLWATLDSTAKIASVVSGATGVVLDTYSQNLSSVRTRQLRDNRSTAWEEIVQLLNTGNSAGARLLCSVTPQGTLVVDAEPTYDAQTALVWTRDGRLRYSNGRYLLPGVLPVGKWVQVEALLQADWQADTTRFLVDAAEYDAQAGRWTLQPKGAPNPFDLGTEQG